MSVAAASAPRVPAPVRFRDPATRWASLTAADHQALDAILRSEADMAYRRRARILLDYLELRDGHTVYDCGCGMGFYIMAMARLRRLRLVGLDGDVSRLEWGQRASIPGALVQGDIERQPFAPESFDRVLMTEVLEHVQDDVHALREVYRLLRPGGVLALSVPNAEYPFWWDPINRIWTGVGGAPIRSGPIVGIWTYHQRLYRAVEVVSRITGAGFTVEAVEETTHYSFPFIHFLVYGVGKPLLQRNLLPSSLRKSADRFGNAQRAAPAQSGGLNPITLGIAAFRAVDRLNDRPGVAGKRTFMNVLVKARKPG